MGTDIVLILLQIIFFLVLGRVLMSWIPMFTQRPLNYDNPLVRFLYQTTEPMLAPIRRFTTFGMIDLSPLVLIIVIQVVSGALASEG